MRVVRGHAIAEITSGDQAYTSRAVSVAALTHAARLPTIHVRDPEVGYRFRPHPMRPSAQCGIHPSLAVAARRVVAALFLFVLVASQITRVEAAPKVTARGADAGLDAAAAKGDADDAGDAGSLEARRDELRALDARLATVRALLSGQLPAGLDTAELFEVRLLDASAVGKRIAELRADLKRRRLDVVRGHADGGSPSDAGAPDAGRVAQVDGGPSLRETELAAMGDRALDAEKLRLEVAFDEARVAFLGKSVEFRAHVLAAEKEQRKVAAAKVEVDEEQRRAAEETRLAEAAHKQAVLDAERARGATERAIANERVRAEDVRRDQAKYRRTLSARKKEAAKQAEDRHERVFALVESSRTVAAGPAADALYDTILADLGIVRTNVDRAFANDASVVPAPKFELDPASLPPPGGPLEADRVELVELTAQLEAASKNLTIEATALAREQLTLGIAREGALDGARLSLLDRLTPDRRADVLGLGHTGLLQLQLEVWSLKTHVRFYRLTMNDTLRDLRVQLSTPAMLGVLVTRLLAVIGVLAAVLYTRRRHVAWLTSIRSALPRLSRSARVLRVTFAGLDALEALFDPLLFLALLKGIHFVLGTSLERFEPGWVVYRLAFWLGVYKLAIRAAHRLIAKVSSSPRAPVSGATSDKILFSLRLVGRYSFTVVLLLVSAQAIVGNGYLYRVVLRFAWFGAVPIGFVLVRRWRGDIADAYLRYRPVGGLADAVRSTRTRWYGFFVAVAAFAAISAAAVTRAGRRFLLGFENSRKVLAYVFRKRLERKAADEGPAEVPPLPADLARHFSEDPLADLGHALDHFPEIDVVKTAFDQWLDTGDRVGAVLVVGPSGFGKSTWLNKAALQLEGPRVHRLKLGRRIGTPAGLAEAIGAAVDAPAEARVSVDALAEYLRLERRTIVIDELQQLVLRGVDTWGGWEALNTLVERTGPNVFWLCAMAHYPYKFVRFARKGTEFFRHVVRLAGWRDEEITALLRQRTTESGYEVVYDDLVVRDVEGVERAAHLVTTEREYMRLLWDYSDGSPRVALHFWARSLVPDGDHRVRARLFHGPDVDLLESLEETHRFVLACVLWHENVTAAEASVSLRYPPVVVDDAIARLTEIGALTLTADGARHRITTHWVRAIVRFLMRKHLVEP